MSTTYLFGITLYFAPTRPTGSGSCLGLTNPCGTSLIDNTKLDRELRAAGTSVLDNDGRSMQLCNPLDKGKP